MKFKTPNKSWSLKRLMSLSKCDLWKFAGCYDDTVKNLGIDYFTKIELADIVNYELLKIERENEWKDLPSFLGGPE